MEHEKCDYIRAVLEGVAMNLGIILEKQRENGEIQDLVLTGGGAKGDTLSQILADVLGVRLHRLDQVETATSVAAAVIAGIGVGVFKDFSVVDQFVKRERHLFRVKNISRYMIIRNCLKKDMSVCWIITKCLQKNRTETEVCKMYIKTYKEKEDIQHETWNLLRLLGK